MIFSVLVSANPGKMDFVLGEHLEAQLMIGDNIVLGFRKIQMRAIRIGLFHTFEGVAVGSSSQQAVVVFTAHDMAVGLHIAKICVAIL